jgi:hemolysin activation/secretion protein
MNLLKKSLIFTSLCLSLPVWAQTPGSEPAPKARPTLTIYEYQITGNTVLDPRDIERTLAPFLGENQEVSSVEKAAKKIERLYKDKGYPTVYVNIPEQDIRKGVIKMSVVEGKVQRLRITGANHYTLSGIRNELPAVKEGETPYFPDFQAQITKVNARSQHLKVTPVLKPGKTPGGVDIELKVKDELPWVNQLTLSNYNSANTTRPRLEFNTAYNNLWQKDHGVSLQYQTSPEDTQEVRIWGVTYLLPVYERHKAAIYYVNSDSAVASLGGETAFTALGKGNIYGLRYIIPLESHTKFLHSLTLDFDYKDFADTLEFGRDGETLRNDLAPIDYGVFGFDYDVTFMREKGSDRFSFGSRWGMRGLNDDEEFETKRKLVNAEPNFSFMTLGARLSRDVFNQWQVRLNTKAQFTDSTLIGNEQFSIGGNETVRGYFQSEALGDTGIYAQAELRTPVLFKNQKWVKDWRVLAFVDAGEVKVKSPLPEQTARNTLASAGVGMRLKALRNLSVSVDVAQALNEGVKSVKDDWRVDGQLRWQF